MGFATCSTLEIEDCLLRKPYRPVFASVVNEQTFLPAVYITLYHGPPATDEVEEDHDNGCDKKQVNQAAADMEPESRQPEHK
jgi:hypothetical protein